MIVCLLTLAGGTRSYLLSAFAVDALMTVGVLAMVAHWAGLREPIEAPRHAFIGVLKAKLTSGLLCISAAPRAVVWAIWIRSLAIAVVAHLVLSRVVAVAMILALGMAGGSAGSEVVSRRHLGGEIMSVLAGRFTHGEAGDDEAEYRH